MLTNIQLLCGFPAVPVLPSPKSPRLQGRPGRSKGKRDGGQERSENINVAVESPPPSYRPQVLHLRMQMFPVEPSIICGNSWRKRYPRSFLLSFDTQWICSIMQSQQCNLLLLKMISKYVNLHANSILAKLIKDCLRLFSRSGKRRK